MKVNVSFSTDRVSEFDLKDIDCSVHIDGNTRAIVAVLPEILATILCKGLETSQDRLEMLASMVNDTIENIVRKEEEEEDDEDNER